MLKKPTQMLSWIVAPLALAGVLLLAPGQAQADTVMLMMESGPEQSERMSLLSQELESAGHEIMVTGASLEDSALMLGCEASEGACIDSVIETGGADAAVIVPQDAGSLLVRRKGEGTRADVVAGASDYQWKVALSEAFGLPAPAAPPSAEDPLSGATFSGSAEPTGGYQFSNIKTRSWTVLGSGVAVSALGLVLLNIAAGKQDDVDNHAIDTAADFEALRDLESSGKNFNTAGNIFVIAGGLTTLAGVGLMVWDMKSGASEGGPTLVPSASETSVGVSLRWGNL